MQLEMRMPMDPAGPRLVLPRNKEYVGWCSQTGPRTNEYWGLVAPLLDLECPEIGQSVPRMSSALWNSSANLCSSLSDPYASEASSPFPNNNLFNIVQFLNFPALRIQ